MKKVFTLMFIVLLSMTKMYAQSDDQYVANWQLPIDFWFAGVAAPAEGIDGVQRKQAMAEAVTNFDAVSADFDATWASVPGDGNVIGASSENIFGLAGSNTGPDDFKDAAFKVLYDESSMYILLQFTDDDVTGEEFVELCTSPYLKLDATDREDFPTAWYTRWSQFGANKITVSKNGLSAAMMVNFDSDGVGHIDWGGTTDILSNNIFVDDHTVVGSNTVKWIISVGYPALTGEYRPDFNTEIWKSLNEGKGISFDMKVNDKDADDALSADEVPVQQPAEYWWNSTNYDGWMCTIYAGFLGAKDGGSTGGNSDDEYVANWQLPIDFWFAGVAAPAEGIDGVQRKQAMAEAVTNFDAVSADFDATWASVPGDGNVIGASSENIFGLPGSNTGPDDFKDAAFKVLYDESSMYILLQFTDDDVTGEEFVELCTSPYLKLDATDREDFPTAWYTRWSQFGANKITVNKNGLSAAMMVNFDSDGVGHIDWGGTTDILSNNIFVDDHTAIGSNTVKWIISVGYPALTGEYRPDFNTEIWKSLNEGKGISFDMKVNDKDADDALSADEVPVQQPAEYWWNSTNYDGWMCTIYAGFLGAKDGGTVGIPSVRSMKSIFGQISTYRIQLNESANVSIYDVLGQPVSRLKNVNQIDLSHFNTGVYIIRANNEVKKLFITKR